MIQLQPAAEVGKCALALGLRLSYISESLTLSRISSMTLHQLPGFCKNDVRCVDHTQFTHSVSS
jgi:hypothetical protein